jgi:hypothetical protein
MKPTRIVFQIVKNLGNYQTARLEVEYSLENENDTDISTAFKKAKFELENAFNDMYQPTAANYIAPKASTPPTPTKKPLAMNTPEFERVCSALYGQRTDRNEVATYYELTPEIIEYFDKHNL